MDKYDSCIIQIIFYGSFIIFYCGVFKEFIIFASTAVDSNYDKDGMDYLSESFSSEVDWLFSGETTNCKKLSLDCIVGLN